MAVLRRVGMGSLALLLCAPSVSQPAVPPLALSTPAFRVAMGADRGTLLTLSRTADAADLNFLAGGTGGARLGDFLLRYRRTDLTHKAPQTWISFASMGARPLLRRDADGRGVTSEYRLPVGDRPAGLRVVERIRAEGDTLRLSLTLHNDLDVALEVGDIGLPLPFADRFGKETDASVTYTRHVLRHGGVAGDNSHYWWTRTDGEGPRLVMTPVAGTRLEYFRQEADEGPKDYTAYIHALAEAGDMEPRGTWPERPTALILAARGSAAATRTYAFDFAWAEDDAAVQRRLVGQGLLDIEVQPGLTIPTDLDALASVGGARLDAVDAQFPAETTVERLPSPAAGRTLLRFRFRRLGENAVTLRWGTRTTRLEYFVTEPLDTLIRKRAAFLVANQQVRDPSKWYDGMFSLWDVEERVLRTPDDLGGLHDYMVGGGDDPDLGKAPYIAAKNLAYPDDHEIAAIEYYLERFVWGKLQRTDRERPFPYGIYGVPNWKQLREAPQGYGSGGFGRERMWRAYDYPHLIQLYLTMSRIATLYPDTVRYLDAKGYLRRAFGTARAYFAVPHAIRMAPSWGFPGFNDWAYKLGVYHEQHIVDLIDALDAAGLRREAAEVRGEWEKKATYFAYDARYPFGSEMNFDTTAFQSSHALARYGATRDMAPGAGAWRDKNSGKEYRHPRIDRADFRRAMERSIRANLAARGTREQNYYQLGSDYRGGSMRYLLSYMSQMGGLAILDYGLNFAADPAPSIRMGYQGLLSSWALVNSGPAATEHGYWYPGRANDGAAGWGFTARKYGQSVFATNIQQGRGPFRYDGEIENGYSEAVAAATTVVTQDPLFGLVAYGGRVRREGGDYLVDSRDGVRQRLALRDGGGALDLALDRDGFAEDTPLRIAADRTRLAFRLAPRTADAHATTLIAHGLPPGRYRGPGGTVLARAGQPARFAIPAPRSAGPIDVTITRQEPAG